MRPLPKLDRRTWFRIAVFLSLASAGLTLFLAGMINEIWEEAHYRTAGQVLKWGYPDTPPGAPMLAALSADIFGHGRLGPRVLTWGFSSLFPVAVWFLASAVTTPRRALMAATLGAVIPVFVVVGAFAYPEGPLQTLALTFMGFLVRAVDTDKLKWWIGAGLICAMGVAYYYRFWFVPFGVLIFLISTVDGRALWKRRHAWIGGAIAMLGLIPAIIDNVTNNFQPILFHLVGRQDWAFWPRGALYPFEQAGLVTPILFIFVLAGGWRAWQRRIKTGDRSAGLIIFTSAAVSLPYFAVAIFDKDYLLHWPILAWALLLVYAPDAMIGFNEAMRRRGWTGIARIVLILGPVFAIVATLLAAGLLMLWREPGPLAKQGRQNLLMGGDFEDWTVLRPTLTKAFDIAGPNSILIGSDHITTARIQTTAQLSVPVAVLDHPEDASRSFQQYRAMLGEGEGAIVNHADGAAVIVMKDPDYLYRDPERVAMRQKLCNQLAQAELIDRISLQPGRIRVSVFTARIRSAGEPAIKPGACPLFPHGEIEQPKPGQTISGEIIIYGVAAHPEGVSKTVVMLDGKALGTNTERVDLSGYRFPQVLDFDPTYPNVYWAIRADLSKVTQGSYVMSLVLTTKAGEEQIIETRTIYVR